MLGWSENDTILHGQTDSQLEITTQLDSKAGHWLSFSYIFWFVEFKTALIDAILIFLRWNSLPLHVYLLHPYESDCGIDYTEELSKMAGIQLEAYNRVYPLKGYELL